MFANQYLEKNKKYFTDIEIPPHSDLKISIVIPCFNEPCLLRTLDSLFHCDPPHCAVEVIVVINSSEKSPAEALSQNLKTIEEAEIWKKNHSKDKLRLHLIVKTDLPEKDAGVGLARKIGMDAATARFNTLNRPDGIIAGFDADSVCDKNYLTEIEQYFNEFPETNAASVYFEHPLQGNEFTHETYNGIIQYELHLRYFNQALRCIKFPYAFHTIGSSFTVKASVYVKQGGMNKRQAGEDFYFLHKVIPLGNYVEINSTRVIPSPRPSDRVPFGTGATIKKMADNKEDVLTTYNLKSFLDIKQFIDRSDLFFDADEDRCHNLLEEIPKPLRNFLVKNNFLASLAEINNNSANTTTFRKRFFVWFNAFRIIKFLNMTHIGSYDRIPVANEALKLLKMMNAQYPENPDNRLLLELYRKIDRKVD